MQINILGKRWNLQFCRIRSITPPNTEPDRGFCDPPTKVGKKLCIEKRLTGEEELEVTLHEMLHASGWHLDEGYVHQFAEDAARVLWRLGWRRSK